MEEYEKVNSYNHALAEMFARQIDNNFVYGKIVDTTPRQLTRKEKIHRLLRNWKSYLTRYQIVDTWTMHDHCDY